MYFMLLPTCFQKEKKTQKQPNKTAKSYNSSRFHKHIGKVYAVGRMVSYQANMHVRAKIPTGRTGQEGRKRKGKYTVSVAAEKHICCHCRYPVDDRTAENSVDKSLPQDLERDTDCMQLPQ